jgi:hypothetical protein
MEMICIYKNENVRKEKKERLKRCGRVVYKPFLRFNLVPDFSTAFDQACYTSSNLVGAEKPHYHFTKQHSNLPPLSEIYLKF